MRSPDFSVNDGKPLATPRRFSNSAGDFGEFGSCPTGFDADSGWSSGFSSPKPSKHWAQNPPGLSAGMAVPHSLHLLPEITTVLYKRNGAQTLPIRRAQTG